MTIIACSVEVYCMGAPPTELTSTAVDHPAGVACPKDGQGRPTPYRSAVPSLKEYTKALLQRGEVSDATARRIHDTISTVTSAAPLAPCYTLGVGPDDMVGFTWTIERHYFNLELYADGRYEAFYEDLDSHAMWSDEGMKISAEFLRRLQAATEVRLL